MASVTSKTRELDFLLTYAGGRTSSPFEMTSDSKQENPLVLTTGAVQTQSEAWAAPWQVAWVLGVMPSTQNTQEQMAWFYDSIFGQASRAFPSGTVLPDMSSKMY